MSFDTGKRVHRYSEDMLPMSNDVISMIKALEKIEGQPLVASIFVFEWCFPRELVNINNCAYLQKGR